MPFSNQEDPSLSENPFNGTECATLEENSFFIHKVPELEKVQFKAKQIYKASRDGQKE